MDTNGGPAAKNPTVTGIDWHGTHPGRKEEAHNLGGAIAKERQVKQAAALAQVAQQRRTRLLDQKSGDREGEKSR